MDLLTMKNIGKTYGSNKVLNNISLSIKEGEVHGLVGENGAGKSTLMNILFGMPVIHSTGGFEGEMLINGEPFNPKSPEEAMEMGIGMVHQEFMLIPGFTITENVKLNREQTKPTLFSKIFGKKLDFLDMDSMGKDARKALDRLDMADIDEFLPVAGMPVGYMQFIEIAREIDKSQLKLLVLDEPTAVLAESEAAHFLEVVERLKDMGIAILFISHRLNEVKQITDYITVLRDGQMVDTMPTDDITTVDIARLMVGRDIDLSDALGDRVFEDGNILELKNFEVQMPGERIRGIDLDIRKGEILGVGGLAGQGKIGLANGIMGLYETSGTMIKDGQELPLNNPREALKSSIAFLSEDRRGVGLLLDDSIEFNIAVSSLEIQNNFLKKVGPLKLIDRKKTKEHADVMIKDLDIRCRNSKQNTRYLSGGNQQKVCIARALTLEPDLLLVSEPTRGIDIGAKNLVLDTLIKLNEELNMTIIITSSELAELRQISDRIAIISEGEIQGILKPDDSDENFGLLMAGEDIDEAIKQGGGLNEKDN